MTPTFREICSLDSFKRDLKKLTKKYPSLDEDISNFVEAQLKLLHKYKTDNGGVVRLSGLGKTDINIYKARRFACKSLKGRGSRSGIRIIYHYDETEDRIVFIEIYSKSEEKNEDRSRILDYIKSLD